MEKKMKKDKVLLVSSLILAGIVIIILAAAFLFPVLEAKTRLSNTEDAFREFSESDMLIISDPLFEGEGIPKPSEAALEFGDGADICRSIVRILEGAKYSETKKTLLGSWSTSVSLRGDEDIFTVYFTDDGFYLAKEQKQYRFAPDGDMLAEYDALLDELETVLTESAKK